MDVRPAATSEAKQGKNQGSREADKGFGHGEFEIRLGPAWLGFFGGLLRDCRDDESAVFWNPAVLELGDDESQGGSRGTVRKDRRLSTLVCMGLRRGLEVSLGRGCCGCERARGLTAPKGGE